MSGHGERRAEGDHCRGPHARAGAIEDQPVVATLDVVALNAAQGQRHFPMRTGIGECAIVAHPLPERSGDADGLGERVGSGRSEM